MRKILIICGLGCLGGCSPEGGQSPTANLRDQLVQGKTLYEESCAQCHYEGEGSSTAPDLIGSPVLAEPPEAMARIILTGRQGESMQNGKKFDGFMPAQTYLRDDEIAAIVVYVRDALGGRREPFQPGEVKKIRATNAGR